MLTVPELHVVYLFVCKFVIVQLVTWFIYSVSLFVCHFVCSVSQSGRKLVGQLVNLLVKVFYSQPCSTPS
jgi:hypothetical protein